MPFQSISGREAPTMASLPWKHKYREPAPMPPKTLRESLAEEARYGLADIRAAWEEAWFGRPVTPSTWHQIGTGEAHGRQGEEPGRGGSISERAEWEAKCRAFFDPPAEPTRNGDRPAQDRTPIDR